LKRRGGAVRREERCLIVGLDGAVAIGVSGLAVAPLAVVETLDAFDDATDIVVAVGPTEEDAGEVLDDDDRSRNFII
jgi:hypothetical protein